MPRFRSWETAYLLPIPTDTGAATHARTHARWQSKVQVAGLGWLSPALSRSAVVVIGLR